MIDTSSIGPQAVGKQVFGDRCSADTKAILATRPKACGKPCRYGLPYGNHDLRVFRTRFSAACAFLPTPIGRPPPSWLGWIWDDRIFEGSGLQPQEALRAPYPPPETAEAKAKVAAIREKLAEVVAFERTGKYREGLELGRKLEEEANAVDYRPVQAEVLFELGWLLDKTGECRTAETTLHEAARAAGKSRDGLLAAKATTSLVFVVGYGQARHEAGLLHGRAAEVMLGVAGGDERIRADLLKSRASLFISQGKFDKAREYYRKSLAIYEKALGPEHPDVARTVNNLGVVYYHMGEYDEALVYWDKSMAIQEKALGPEHPHVALSLNNMGGVLNLQGEHDKALDYHRKALTIREKVLGPKHPDVAMSLANMGEVFSAKGEYDKV